MKDSVTASNEAEIQALIDTITTIDLTDENTSQDALEKYQTLLNDERVISKITNEIIGSLLSKANDETTRANALRLERFNANMGQNILFQPIIDVEKEYHYEMQKKFKGCFFLVMNIFPKLSEKIGDIEYASLHTLWTLVNNADKRIHNVIDSKNLPIGENSFFIKMTLDYKLILEKIQPRFETFICNVLNENEKPSHLTSGFIENIKKYLWDDFKSLTDFFLNFARLNYIIGKDGSIMESKAKEALKNLTENSDRIQAVASHKPQNPEQQLDEFKRSFKTVTFEKQENTKPVNRQIINIHTILSNFNDKRSSIFAALKNNIQSSDALLPDKEKELHRLLNSLKINFPKTARNVQSSIIPLNKSLENALELFIKLSDCQNKDLSLEILVELKEVLIRSGALFKIFGLESILLKLNIEMITQISVKLQKYIRALTALPVLSRNIPRNSSSTTVSRPSSNASSHSRTRTTSQRVRRTDPERKSQKSESISPVIMDFSHEPNSLFKKVKREQNTSKPNPRQAQWEVAKNNKIKQKEQEQLTQQEKQKARESQKEESARKQLERRQKEQEEAELKKQKKIEKRQQREIAKQQELIEKDILEKLILAEKQRRFDEQIQEDNAPSQSLHRISDEEMEAVCEDLQALQSMSGNNDEPSFLYDWEGPLTTGRFIEFPKNERWLNQQVQQWIEFLEDEIFARGYVIYPVGGFVRDSLLGITPHDIDCATNCPEVELLAIANSLMNPLVASTKLSCVKSKARANLFRIGDFIDIFYVKEENQVFLQTIARDFSDITINRLALSREREVLDALNSIKDIEKDWLVLVGDPNEVFPKDPIRMLRIIHLSTHTKKSILELDQHFILHYADRLIELPFGRYLSIFQTLFLRGLAEINFFKIYDLEAVSYLLPPISSDNIVQVPVELENFWHEKLKQIDKTHFVERRKKYSSYHPMALLLLLKLFPINQQWDNYPSPELMTEAIEWFCENYPESSSYHPRLRSQLFSALQVYAVEFYELLLIDNLKQPPAYHPMYEGVQQENDQNATGAHRVEKNGVMPLNKKC